MPLNGLQEIPRYCRYRRAYIPGFPRRTEKARHLQSSASLLFKVFSEYDLENILLRQAYQEVFDQQMEEVRLRNALRRIGSNPIKIIPEKKTNATSPSRSSSTAGSRYNLSSERIEDRIKRMQQQLEQTRSFTRLPEKHVASVPVALVYPSSLTGTAEAGRSNRV